MGLKEIFEFIKIEHTLFSLPFVFIGAMVAVDPTWTQLLWILVAAVGARGLAMALNRMIDKDIDAANPRTAGRHLPSGSLSITTAWALSAAFLSMLIFGAWMLNEIALQLAWLPVLTFAIYPFLKRRTWACHFWLGLCLGLAPAGAWIGIVGEDLGWSAITALYWWPQIFLLSFGVMLWITAFDMAYALMDVDSDLANGIHSFPARFGAESAIKFAVFLSILYAAVFILSDIGIWWNIAAISMAAANIITLTSSRNDMEQFQSRLFKTSVSTGWVLLLGLFATLHLS